LTQERRREERVHEESKERERREQLSNIVGQFECVIAADKAVSRQLRREVDALEEELRHIREAKDQMEKHVSQDTRDAERLASQRTDLERQMEDGRRRLGEQREDRRAVNLESISLRRDREHFADELAFLKRTFEDEERTMEVLQKANNFLEKAYHDLELHTVTLERQRKDLLSQVQQEGDLVRKQERQNAEMRNHLQRLRREQNTDNETRREASMREMAIREMQSDGPPVPAYVPAAAAGDSHSWAQRVVPPRPVGTAPVGSGSALSAGGLGIAAAAAPAVPRTVPGLGLSREGV